MKCLSFTIFLFQLIVQNESAKILAIFHIPSRSHYHLGVALTKDLAKKGHEVTMLSPYGEKTSPPGKYRDIVLTGLDNYIKELLSKQPLLNSENMDTFTSMKYFAYLLEHVGEKAIEHDNFQKLIKSKETFDVIIIEQFFNDGYKALAKIFKAHLVVFSTIHTNFWVNPLVGNPSPSSYIPSYPLSYPANMTFSQRLFNNIVLLYNNYLLYHHVYPKQDELIKKYISKDIDLSEVLYNTSLVLVNSHPSTNQPVPMVPNMIEIGGFHVPPPKKLPKDLKEFLNNATEGVIYFSLGSNINSTHLPLEKKQAISKVFAGLKEKVLWKWEEEHFEGCPSNVKLSKWFPQSDLLAHPNIKLFITHGGLLSTIETVYHGVPILAIPIFGDQKMNAQLAVNSGFGLVLPYQNLNYNSLKEKIGELLNNPRYRNNAKRRSKIFHDRPVKPLDLARYWIEYLINHQGGDHLRVEGVNIVWYKYFLLDVIFVIVLTIGTVLGLISFILNWVDRNSYKPKYRID